jgi:hypothetical protein
VKNHNNTIDNNILDVAVFHGSDKVIKTEDIILPGIRKYYDFGPGFYLTENKKTAEEWVVDEQTPVVNEYRLRIPKHEVLFLADRDWLQVVVGYRSKQFSASFRSSVIHGLIANDRLVDAIEIFKQGAIGDLRLFECLQMVELGNQYLIRENKNCLTWVRSSMVKGAEIQRADSRRRQKRLSLEKRVRAVYRKYIPGEMFYDDFLEKGVYNEV